MKPLDPIRVAGDIYFAEFAAQNWHFQKHKVSLTVTTASAGRPWRRLQVRAWFLVPNDGRGCGLVSATIANAGSALAAIAIAWPNPPTLCFGKTRAAKRKIALRKHKQSHHEWSFD